SFYEETSLWRMEVWTQWNPVFQPGGELITRLFGRRVQQLALPTQPLAMAHGVDSRVVPILGPDGEQRAAAWMRTRRSTGESGNVQVFLRPIAEPDGSFTLSSPRGAFGDDGAYVVVDSPKGTHAKRLPIHETFHVYVDSEGVLRTDHELRLWSVTVVRFHYKLTKQGERGRDSAGAAKPQRADCTDRNGLASSGVEGAQG